MEGGGDRDSGAWDSCGAAVWMMASCVMDSGGSVSCVVGTDGTDSCVMGPDEADSWVGACVTGSEMVDSMSTKEVCSQETVVAGG